MRNRGSQKVQAETGEIGGDRERLISSFYETNVRNTDKLFWKILSITRRNTQTSNLVAEVQNLPQNQRAKIWRLAHRWLPPPEFGYFAEHLKALKEKDWGSMTAKLPFGKTRAFAEGVRRELRDVL